MQFNKTTKQKLMTCVFFILLGVLVNTMTMPSSTGHKWSPCGLMSMKMKCAGYHGGPINPNLIKRLFFCHHNDLNMEWNFSAKQGKGKKHILGGRLFQHVFFFLQDFKHGHSFQR